MTVTVAPAFTDSAENENPEMVITAPVAADVAAAGAEAVDELAAALEVDSVGAGVDALEHDATASASTVSVDAVTRTWGCLMLV